MKRNNCIESRYRSITQPRPLWPEVALYGGYKYIELTEGCWLPRVYEYLLLCIESDVSPEIQKLALQDLKNNVTLFKPTPVQQSDYTKLIYTLSRQTAFAVQGYSQGLQNILERMPQCTVYTDSDYTTSHCVAVSTEQICKNSSTILTLIPSQATDLKSNISNWGNIIVYDSEFFIEDNANGGLLCQI